MNKELVIGTLQCIFFALVCYFIILIFHLVMGYKVLLNTANQSDCECCIFRGKCNGKCPLQANWYFGSSRSKKTDIVDVWDAK